MSGCGDSNCESFDSLLHGDLRAELAKAREENGRLLMTIQRVNDDGGFRGLSLPTCSAVDAVLTLATPSEKRESQS